MTHLEKLLMRFVGRLLYLQLTAGTDSQSTQEFLENRKKEACALVDELIGGFYITYKLKDEKVKELIWRELNSLHKHEDNSLFDEAAVETNLAVLSLNHLLFGKFEKTAKEQ